ncbi:hypothetical protein [Methylobacterium fujisawaense]
MYFFLAFWYAVSTIGFISIGCFFAVALCLFDSNYINQNIGYRNFFLLLGSYALVAVPFAATIAKGFDNGNFLFCLGCMIPAIWSLGDKLTEDYTAKLSAMLAAQAAAAAAIPPQPDPAQATHSFDLGPTYVPAPSSLAADFDVPPQR